MSGVRGAALLMEMGTGKTLTTIALIGRAFLNGLISRALIVAPLSVANVWAEEFEKFAAFDYVLAVLEGDSGKKADTLRHMTGTDLQVVVLNYESTWRLEEELRKWKPDVIVCDESSRIKNPNAKQSKALHRLAKLAKYRLILTGTPIQNNPLDFFSQYKVLDESIFGPSYYAFRSRYATLGGYGNHQIVGYKNLPELVQKAHSVAYRVTKEEALDLPEMVDETRYVTLDPQGMKIYESLEAASYAELLKGEVVVRNILTQLLRLQQVTGGFIRDDKGGPVQQVSKAKLMALEEIIDDVLGEGKKLVIFARFVPEIDAISKLLAEKGIKHSVISGEIKNRSEQVQQFQENPEVKVFVSQIQTTGLGLTLTAANTAIFYSMDFNYANYSQARARIHRIGQRNTCTYIHLVAKDTIDEKVLKTLQRKEDVAKLLVDNWHTFFRR
ncbi:MAG: DEAD/DEAH box helicase [Methanobacterium sp.]|jgi:SNF2 family DNA or RNA helicase|uniref:DEAD/DEAH box helicase n=1 Tax=Methanobacterium sp. TaxID=2164 RepID=UPI003D8C888E